MVTIASIGSVYQHGIVDTGREAHFLFFVAFLLTFGFIRTSTHMIKAQVKWWPGNVSVGGTHIHHLVWGILLLLINGYIGIARDPSSPCFSPCPAPVPVHARHGSSRRGQAPLSRGRRAGERQVRRGAGHA